MSGFLLSHIVGKCVCETSSSEHRSLAGLCVSHPVEDIFKSLAGLCVSHPEEDLFKRFLWNLEQWKLENVTSRRGDYW